MSWTERSLKLKVLRRFFSLKSQEFGLKIIYELNEIINWESRENFGPVHVQAKNLAKIGPRILNIPSDTNLIISIWKLK